MHLMSAMFAEVNPTVPFLDHPLWIFGEYISQNRSHPQGPKSEFKEVTAAHVGCHCSGLPANTYPTNYAAAPCS